MKLIIRLLLNGLALVITDKLLTGITISDYKTVAFAAVLLAVVNTFIRPVLLLISLPLNFMTLGLFTFVINALLLSLVAWILGPSFSIANFGWALIAALVLSIVSTVLSILLKSH